MLWKSNNFDRKNLIIVKFFEVCYSILMKGLLMKRKGAKKVEYAMLRLLAEKYKDDIFRFCVRLTGETVCRGFISRYFYASIASTV